MCAPCQTPRVAPSVRSGVQMAAGTLFWWGWQLSVGDLQAGFTEEG